MQSRQVLYTPSASADRLNHRHCWHNQPCGPGAQSQQASLAEVAMPKTKATSTPGKELRIGLVISGGSSLAVYMNGIVTEIWNAVRASRNVSDDGTLPGGGSVSVYGDLLEALEAADCAPQLQVVVDTIAGTSAGGINATTLAKAIVEGADARIPNETWINEACVESLRATPPRRLGRTERRALRIASLLWPKLRKLSQAVESLPGLDWDWAVDQLHSMRTSTDGSETLFNGQYFTRVLAKSLKRMSARTGPALIDDHHRFDLFLPQTDLFGWRRRLPITGLFHTGAVYERTHAHMMSFSSHGAELADDFALTYATRATAGFPIAFAPVTFRAVEQAYREARPGDAVPDRQSFSRLYLREQELAGSGKPPAREWMLDGGILDNRPFSHVASAIDHKPAISEVHRVVVYIEPSPTRTPESARTRPPATLEVATGVWHLLGRQPIYDDLVRLRDRNRKARRVRQMVAATRRSFRSCPQAAGDSREGVLPGTVSWWVTRDVGFRQQPSFAGYVVLSALSAARSASKAVCQALHYPPHSQYAFFVQALGRAWLDYKGWLVAPAFDQHSGCFQIPDGQFELLHSFDVAIRRRWLGSLVGVANREFERLDGAGNYADQHRRALDRFKGKVASLYERVDQVQREMGRTALARLNRLISNMDIDIAVSEVTDASHRQVLVKRFDGVLMDAFQRICNRVSRQWKEFNDGIRAAIGNLPEGGLLERIEEELLVFPDLDQVAFPLMDSADMVDLTEIEVMRISPMDSALLPPERCSPLGASLGGFAGFLDRPSRENDLLLGRLHAAERLVDLIARAAAGTEDRFATLRTLRDRFKRLAIEAILRDEDRRPNSAVSRVRALLEEGELPCT